MKPRAASMKSNKREKDDRGFCGQSPNYMIAQRFASSSLARRVRCQKKKLGGWLCALPLTNNQDATDLSSYY
jgi:hypothetical protein